MAKALAHARWLSHGCPHDTIEPNRPHVSQSLDTAKCIAHVIDEAVERFVPEVPPVRRLVTKTRWIVLAPYDTGRMSGIAKRPAQRTAASSDDIRRHP